MKVAHANTSRRLGMIDGTRSPTISSHDAKSDQSDETTMHVGTMPGGDTATHVSCCHARGIAELEARC